MEEQPLELVLQTGRQETKSLKKQTVEKQDLGGYACSLQNSIIEKQD
jgi:hypothetical protein